MELNQWNKKNRRTDRRVKLISELARRQDELLRARTPDLDAIERLTYEFEAAGLNLIAEKLAIRLAWLRVESFWALEASEAARKDGGEPCSRCS